MAVDARPCTSSTEFRQALWGIGQYFGAPPNDEAIERFLKVLPFERMHAGLDDGQIVGGAGVFPFELSVPGGTVPTAGVTVVGVYPSHRRRGVLRAMMRAQLEDVHARGEPLAALWASEETIYGRFGYGLAAWCGEVRIPREYGGFARPFERAGSFRFLEPEEAREQLPPVLEAMRRARPGMFERSPDWWADRVIRDPEDRREGAGPKRFVAHELDGEIDAYAIYRHKPSWDGGTSSATLVVVEAIGTTPVGTREIWRYLLDIDWTATIEAGLLPRDHPLFLLLATPRRMKYRVTDEIWVRLVDVGAALSARTYSASGRLVFEVRDAFCEWNEGRWALEDGQAEPTDDEPDLRLDADALGSAYLGGVSFAELERAFRVEEVVAGAIDRADALFRWHAHPWCLEIF